MCVAAGRVIIAMTCYVTDACVYEGKHYQPHDKVKKDCNIWLVSHDFSSLCAALSHIGLSIGGSSSILVCHNLIHHSSAHRLRSFQQYDSLVVMFQCHSRDIYACTCTSRPRTGHRNVSVSLSYRPSLTSVVRRGH